MNKNVQKKKWPPFHYEHRSTILLKTFGHHNIIVKVLIWNNGSMTWKIGGSVSLRLCSNDNAELDVSMARGVISFKSFGRTGHPETPHGTPLS